MTGIRVVIAPDKFRGSLTASEAAAAMARGVKRAAPGARVERVPVADGGEGTAEALAQATGGRLESLCVTGPLGEPVSATLGMLGDGRTAVFEMATASGLALVPPARRDPGGATTRGVGELIRAALERGASRLLIGIGGSATTDGGAGMAQALGYGLLDESGAAVRPGGLGLERLARIEAGSVVPGLRALAIEVACDVQNPLCGPDGAAAVYGPQKGAGPELVGRLDAALGRLADVIERDLGLCVRDQPGAGAAGGLGAGLVAFCGGRLRPGAQLVLEAVGLEERLAGADLCLTGEGALDRSSTFGKAIVGVAAAARRRGVPTFALAGALGAGAEGVLDQGVDAVFGICPRPMGLDAALAGAAANLERAAEQALRAFLAGRARR